MKTFILFVIIFALLYLALPYIFSSINEVPITILTSSTMVVAALLSTIICNAYDVFWLGE